MVLKLIFTAKPAGSITHYSIRGWAAKSINKPKKVQKYEKKRKILILVYCLRKLNPPFGPKEHFIP